MARILWIPSFQPGSYFPAVPIALELVARGHTLTVLCEAASEGRFRSLGCDFRPTTELDALRSVPTPSGGDPDTKRRRHARYVRALFADTTRDRRGSRV